MQSIRTLFAVAAATLVLAAPITAPAAAWAAGPYERGPAPTRTSIEATRGYYATEQITVSSAAVGGAFGGGTIYYPTSTADGTFGAVAVAPGFTARRSSLAWLGPRLASQGFVIFNIDTRTTSDQPAARGTQLLAALDYLTQRSTVRSRIDAGRLGVMGHSMGGGGVLEAASSRPSLQAAVPLTPWNTDRNWSQVQTPTLIVAAENDTVAAPSRHALPFYTSIPGSFGKAYLELAGASHFAPNSSDTTIAAYSISWLKRFIDDDTRYDQFLCPGPTTDRAVSDYRTTCPFPG